MFDIISRPDNLQISTDDTEEIPTVQNLPHLHKLLCLHVQCTFIHSTLDVYLFSPQDNITNRYLYINIT